MAEELLEEALRYEEQASHERDPRIIAFLRRQAECCLAEAALAEGAN